MVQINFASREVSVKIVYYGPGRSGKTTNIEQIHAKAPQDSKGELISIATETDRTLYFDFLPLDLGKIAGMTTKFQLYTVPGQVYYNATRKLVLQGADGVIFVADSAPNMREENLESIENLEENLEENGLDINDIPMVFQWNKRDLPEAMPPDQMSADINKWKAPTCESVAVKGEGVFKTLKLLASLVIKKLNTQHGFADDGKARAPAGAPAAPPPAAAQPKPAQQPVAPAAPSRPPQPASQPVRLAGAGPRPQPAAPQPAAPAVQPPAPARPAAQPPAPARPAAQAQPPRPAMQPQPAAPVPSATHGPTAPPAAVTMDTNPLSREIKRRKEEAQARQQSQDFAPMASKKRQNKSKAPFIIIISLLLGAAAAAVYWLHFVMHMF